MHYDNTQFVINFAVYTIKRTIPTYAAKTKYLKVFLDSWQTNHSVTQKSIYNKTLTTILNIRMC